jgi:hypothetical protein
MIDYLTPQQANILIALSKFKYMTKSHFVAYKVGTKKSATLHSNLMLLREKKLLNRYGFSVTPMIGGRLEDIYFLTEKGAKIVAENLEVALDVIKYPNRSTTEFKNDYAHRVATVSVMISFVLWCEKQEYEIDFFDTYYDKIGSQRKAETGVQSRTRLDLPNDTSISPDAILRYTANGQSYLFCIEVYNGKDTKRVNEQLRKLTYATFEGIPSKKYEHNKANRNLIIMEHENYIKPTIERINNDPYLAQFEGIERFYYFKSIEATKNNFGALWGDLGGNNRNLETI